MPTTSIDPVVAKNLKDTLKRIGRSAYSVAVALRRPPNWLYQITSGKYSISIAALREMADEIGVPVGSLVDPPPQDGNETNQEVPMGLPIKKTHEVVGTHIGTGTAPSRPGRLLGNEPDDAERHPKRPPSHPGKLRVPHLQDPGPVRASRACSRASQGKSDAGNRLSRKTPPDAKPRGTEAVPPRTLQRQTPGLDNGLTRTPPPPRRGTAPVREGGKD